MLVKLHPYWENVQNSIDSWHTNSRDKTNYEKKFQDGIIKDPKESTTRINECSSQYTTTYNNHNSKNKKLQSFSIASYHRITSIMSISSLKTNYIKLIINYSYK